LRTNGSWGQPWCWAFDAHCEMSELVRRSFPGGGVSIGPLLAPNANSRPLLSGVGSGIFQPRPIMHLRHTRYCLLRVLICSGVSVSCSACADWSACTMLERAAHVPRF